jgi:hypothetical protein
VLAADTGAVYFRTLVEAISRLDVRVALGGF